MLGEPLHLSDHLSDQDILLAMDGEASRTDAKRVRAHLTACWIQKGDGPKQKVSGLPTAPAAEISVPLPQLEPGTYVLSWKVMGDDAHIVPGQIHFTVSGGH